MPLITALFYISMGLIWFLVIYQFILTLGGLTLFRKSLRERATILDNLTDLPRITILVPAHNEEMVIERTIEHLLGLNYPTDRLGVLVIDDASTDKTLEILRRLEKLDSRLRIYHRSPEVGGRGKAAALNAVLPYIESDFIAIYDADNCPEPDALKLLMARFMINPDLGAVVGKFRTGNKRKNILTRFINIEGLCFQNVVQSGRWQILGVAALSGTNYIIRRQVLEALGGWDEEALAEDSELSIRMYQHGYQIAFVPYSASWEQEPETFKVWVKQRTRWARGNNYAIAKLVRNFRASQSKCQAIEMLFTLLVPYCFLFAVTISYFILILSLCQVQIVKVPFFISAFWIAALFVYLAEMAMVLSYDEEHSWLNLLISFIMYFSYCQMWLIPVIRALYADCIRRDKRIWDKTVRFDTEIKVRDGAIIKSRSFSR